MWGRLRPAPRGAPESSQGRTYAAAGFASLWRYCLFVLGVRDHNRLKSRVQSVNYRDMTVQQLGSIYERLLEREPARTPDGHIVVRPNSYARKDSGSFYARNPLLFNRLYRYEERTRLRLSEIYPALHRSRGLSLRPMIFCTVRSRWPARLCPGRAAASRHAGQGCEVCNDYHAGGHRPAAACSSLGTGGRYHLGRAGRAGGDSWETGFRS